MQNLAEGPQANSFHRLPAELQAMPQWCVTPGTATDKAPRTIDGRHDSTTDPTTWTDFDTACRVAAERKWRVGFVFTAADPFACIDLDVVNEQTQTEKGVPIDPSKWTTPEEIARYVEIAEACDSYAEVSRSGFGLHILLRANIGPGCKRDGIEVYSQERFLICTGNVWCDKPLADRQEMLANMVTQMRPEGSTTSPLPDQPETEDDAAVIARAQRAANGEKFTALGNGQWQGRYSSQSEADMALMSIIAFYSPNNAQCRRIFRKSELGKRDKATKDDRYLNLTLEPIRARQAAERQRTEAQRASFKLTGEGLPANGDAPLPPTMDMAQMFDDLVYLAAEKQMVLFRSNPSIQLPVPGMAALLKHNRTIIPATEDDPEEREAPTFNLWQGSAQRKVAYTMTFDPSAGEFCTADDGRPAYNLWKPRPHSAPNDWQQRAQLFVDHVAFLMPVETERNRFLDWLAHIEQHPGILPHSHYLMIATQQGVGRNWLAAVLAHVWSGYVAMDFDLKASLNSGFNGQLSRKLLTVVDEINEGGTGERWQHSEKLKSMMTASHRFINAKYGLQHTEKNCARWLIFTNYETGLPLSAEDRRLNVILNPAPNPDDGYYVRLYSVLYPVADAPFISSVRQFLRVRPIAGFNPGARPVMNEAKQAVVAASMTHHDEVAADLVENHPQDLITAEDLFRKVFDVDPSMTDANRRWAILPSIARKAGVEPMPKPFALFGRTRQKVWVLRNAQRWRGAHHWDVERELTRPPGPEAPLSPPA